MLTTDLFGTCFHWTFSQ